MFERFVDHHLTVDPQVVPTVRIDDASTPPVGQRAWLLHTPLGYPLAARHVGEGDVHHASVVPRHIGHIPGQPQHPGRARSGARIETEVGRTIVETFRRAVGQEYRPHFGLFHHVHHSRAIGNHRRSLCHTLGTLGGELACRRTIELLPPQVAIASGIHDGLFVGRPTPATSTQPATGAWSDHAGDAALLAAGEVDHHDLGVTLLAQHIAEPCTVGREPRLTEVTPTQTPLYGYYRHGAAL